MLFVFAKNLQSQARQGCSFSLIFFKFFKKFGIFLIRPVKFKFLFGLVFGFIKHKFFTNIIIKTTKNRFGKFPKKHSDSGN